ncbi:MAG TPA: DUF2090 domain-containing protein [Bryobacteraceae bacterium]|nr:DUF2090 domain-containing protein [Bryobacteraceae bacterium]
MNTLGFDQLLYVLPFDHRGSFQTKLFGWSGALRPDQAAQVSAAKQVVYDGFRAALRLGVEQHRAGILVDEEFGAGLLDDARSRGYMTACPAEKSGQVEFELEYGETFAQHIERFRPTFCKVLVRYNAEGDQNINARQVARLRRLSDHLRNESQSLFMFELLVPPQREQLDRLGSDPSAFDFDHRPRLMLQAIKELQDAGVEPDVWKVEGLHRQADCEQIVALARRDGRDKVGCIVLGRGEDSNKVRDWLVTASRAGFTGFAIGRTTFWDSLVRWRAGRITREQAVQTIAGRYSESVSLFERHAGTDLALKAEHTADGMARQ